jgi:hypothetical protein
MPRETQAVVRFPLEGSGEFGERANNAPMGTRINSEFVVASPQVLHQRVTAHDNSRRVVTLESTHRAEPGFESAPFLPVGDDRRTVDLIGRIEIVRARDVGEDIDRPRTGRATCSRSS